jgi:2-oxoglutarate ferredoxin oxidoreductase subunit alpha
MLSLLKLDLTPAQVGKLRSVVYYTGLPIDARTISDEILAQEREAK